MARSELCFGEACRGTTDSTFKKAGGESCRGAAATKMLGEHRGFRDKRRKRFVVRPGSPSREIEGQQKFKRLSRQATVFPPFRRLDSEQVLRAHPLTLLPNAKFQISSESPRVRGGIPALRRRLRRGESGGSHDEKPAACGSTRLTIPRNSSDSRNLELLAAYGVSGWALRLYCPVFVFAAQ